VNRSGDSLATDDGTRMRMLIPGPGTAPRNRSTLSARLFGKFQIDGGDKTLQGLRVSKVNELFCYLVLHWRTAHNREILANLLWNGIESTQSRKLLRHALWRLQVTLETEGQSTDALSNLLTIEPNWIKLNTAASIWVDVIEFEQTFEVVKDVSPTALDPVAAKTIEDALNLYQGDLLEGWYQEWCLRERERLQYMLLLLIDKLMDYFTHKQEYESAIAHGETALRFERARECTHQRLMRLRYLSGDRTAALRQYQSCVTALQEELGVQPAGGTLALRQQIEMDVIEDLAPSSTNPCLSPRDPSQAVDQMIQNLNRLSSLLGQMQHQVEQDLKFIEQSRNLRVHHDFCQ
jgi:DNA-binding SARP family transcriptional activator